MTKLVKSIVPDTLKRRIKSRIARRYYKPLPQGRGGVLTRKESGVFQVDLPGATFLVQGAAEHDISSFVRDPIGIREFDAFLNASRRHTGFLDVGGHKGLFSGLFCAANPENRAFCFEPSPALAEAARTLASLNGFSNRFHVIERAVGEQRGSSTMLVDPIGGFVQIERFANTMWGEPREIQLEIESVDDFCRDQSTPPTLLKIDVEGYEHEVLLGAAQTLARVRPWVFLELHLHYLEARGIAVSDTLGLLENQKYRFTLLDGTPVSGRELCDCPLSRVHLIARPAEALAAR
ncbi:MAG TPA: FkbM family methyltransferase [Thermoanaerobaculia bacterium]|nr:FkbM family methyltransferase [Thermoanaerobaculia bacterium]